MGIIRKRKAEVIEHSNENYRHKITIKFTYWTQLPFSKKRMDITEEMKTFYSRNGAEWYELPKVKRCDREIEDLVTVLNLEQVTRGLIELEDPDFLLTEEEKAVKDII